METDLLVSCYTCSFFSFGPLQFDKTSWIKLEKYYMYVLCKHLLQGYFRYSYYTNIVEELFLISYLRGVIKKFVDWCSEINTF